MNYQLPTNSVTNFENKLKSKFPQETKKKLRIKNKIENSHKTKQDGEDGYLTVLPM